jgi:hypothetical protein
MGRVNGNKSALLWSVLALDKIEAPKEPKRTKCLRGDWKFLPIISTIQFKIGPVNSKAGGELTRICTCKVPDIMSIGIDFIPLSALDHI